MTEEVPAAAHATPAIETPVATPAAAQPAAPPSDFAIPDVYKDKPWAAKVKSSDDLWKQLENTQSLIGKKAIAPDFKTATPKEIEDYYAQMRPADKSEYQFDETIAPEQKGAYADLLHKHGISAKQGNDLIKDYVALQNTQAAKLFDNDAFVADMKKSFGDNYKEVAFKEVSDILKSQLSEADFKMIDIDMPNVYAAAVYKATAKLQKDYKELAANLHKKYGVTESAAAANAPATVGTVDIESQANKLRDDIKAISRRNHTAEEKQALVNQLANLYKKRT